MSKKTKETKIVSKKTSTKKTISSQEEINILPLPGSPINCNKPRHISGKVWCDDHLDLYIGSCEKVNNLILRHNIGKPSVFKTNACSCKSREIAIISRDTLPNSYTLNVKYCIDEIILKQKTMSGASMLKIDVVPS